MSLPINTSNLKNGKITNTAFFEYAYDKKYYTLDNFSIIGKFTKNNIYYILYNFNLNGEGAGYEENKMVLSAYSNVGKYIENIKVNGKSGGEGGANIYNSIIKDNEILVSVNEEFYESTTGLSYPISLNKNLKYQSKDGLFRLSSNKYVCKESLNQFSTLVKKSYEQKQFNIIAGDYQYKLKSIIDCYPISTENVLIYNDIAFHFLESGQLQTSKVLLEKILKISPTRVVANLNLADNYWELNEKNKAKEAYRNYISLMKSQKKDLSIIPQRVYERSK